MHQQASHSDLAVTASLHSREACEQKDCELHDPKPQKFNQMGQFSWLHSTTPNPQHWSWTIHPLKREWQQCGKQFNPHLTQRPSLAGFRLSSYYNWLPGSSSVVILCYVEFSEACPWAANLLFTTQNTAVPVAVDNHSSPRGGSSGRCRGILHIKGIKALSRGLETWF